MMINPEELDRYRQLSEADRMLERLSEAARVISALQLTALSPEALINFSGLSEKSIDGRPQRATEKTTVKKRKRVRPRAMPGFTRQMVHDSVRKGSHSRKRRKILINLTKLRRKDKNKA